MGCSNHSDETHQSNPNITKETPQNQTPSANIVKNETPQNKTPSGDNVKNDLSYENIGDLIDLSQPIKKIDDATSNILITDDYYPNIIYGDSKGVIHVIYDLDFRKEYEIKEFNDMIRCIIQLSSLIAACSNDCKVKLFSIGMCSYKIIKEIQDSAQIWTLCQIGEYTDFVIGNVDGYFYRCKNRGEDYEIQKRFKIMDKSILNILDVSDSIVMLIYMSSGAYFFDFNTSENVGYVPHEYFNPFRCSILKISDHELLIGAEYSIFLIDYKKFQKIKEFENDASYALYKLSDQYLLTSYGEGLLQIFQMSRDNDGQLELNYLNRSQIIDDIVAGIAKLPDGRFMIFSVKNNITVWNGKNISK